MKRVNIDPDIAVALYRDGRQAREIAAKLGVSKSHILNVLHACGVEMRRNCPRNSKGPRNPNWKGQSAGYRSLHDRVARLYGQPQHCESCGTRDPDKTYDWANLTGDYANLADYKRMCRSCHRFYDSRRRKLQGAEGARQGSFSLEMSGQ